MSKAWVLVLALISGVGVFCLKTVAQGAGFALLGTFRKCANGCCYGGCFKKYSSSQPARSYLKQVQVSIMVSL